MAAGHPHVMCLSHNVKVRHVGNVRNVGNWVGKSEIHIDCYNILSNMGNSRINLGNSRIYSFNMV